jgi:hypothetical protein
LTATCPSATIKKKEAMGRIIAFGWRHCSEFPQRHLTEAGQIANPGEKWYNSSRAVNRSSQRNKEIMERR